MNLQVRVWPSWSMSTYTRLTDLTGPTVQCDIMPDPRLTRAFYRHDPVTVAKALLGQRLVRVLKKRRLAGLIVEVEAYLGVLDQAAHTYNGRRTDRNISMWRDGGTAYVYFTYGMHHCMNVVTDSRDKPTAVLVRALEPVEGLDEMQKHRLAKRSTKSLTTSHRTSLLRDTDLCSGPAKLCQAMGVDRDLDGEDLVASNQLFIEETSPRPSAAAISAAPRIGVDYAGDWALKPLRFFLTNNPHVSRK